MADWMQRCIDQHTFHLSGMFAIPFVDGHSNNRVCHAGGRPDLQIRVDGVRYSLPEQIIICDEYFHCTHRLLLLLGCLNIVTNGDKRMDS